MDMGNERREFGHIFKLKKRDKRTGEKRDLPFWWVRYSINGKRHRESTGSADRRVAEKLLAKREAEVDRDLFVEPSAKRTTFGELATAFLKHYSSNRLRSERRAKTSVKNLAAHFGATWDAKKGAWVGGCRALAITTARIRAYSQEREAAGVANATINLELAALGKMFSLAVQTERLSRKPHIEKLKVSNARKGFFEEADFRALLAELPDFLQPVVEFASLTGWRIPSEVLTLTWAQVDWEAKVVRLEPGTTKNGRGREFPFDTYPPLEALLVAQRDRTRALERERSQVGSVQRVFHRNGEPLLAGSKGPFRKAWHSALDRAAHEGEGALRKVVRPQLLGRIPHDLRRTAVRNFESKGLSRSVAMSLTGHETEAVYRRYAIADKVAQREGVAKLSALHSGGAAVGANDGANRAGGAR
jgi:integrase